MPEGLGVDDDLRFAIDEHFSIITLASMEFISCGIDFVMLFN
jgi:hypothetical protein